MYLIYFDESGNTGTNLNDVQQPVFVLCALAVPESRWLQVEQDLHVDIEKFFPTLLSDDFEIHAADLMAGRQSYKDIPLDNRVAFRDAWFSVAVKHELTLVYRAITKKRFQQWVHDTFGVGIAINPHVAAFPLVARVINDWLDSQPDSPLGIIISDENKEIVRDVEKSIKVLRGVEGSLKLGRIIEKGFFIDSSKSLVLQLCDLCAFTLRKMEEAKAGFRDNALHHGGFALLEPLVYHGDEALRDMLEWITSEEKKKRPGTMS
ncbi:MAG: DUF3800 domain-containing protein [Planctomycetia bacterium]|nr:DUF3800 domain-containing protein [Planctomycetia bacterium]